MERKACRLDSGLADPLDDQAKRPLAQHVADFKSNLAAKGNTPVYVEKVAFRLTALLDDCHFFKIADVQPSVVLTFLGELRAKGKSLKTTNEYLGAAKSFTRWLWRDKRVAADPLAGMARLASKGDVDIRHARRDFSPEELQLLLRKLPKEGILRDKVGQERDPLTVGCQCKKPQGNRGFLRVPGDCPRWCAKWSRGGSNP